jgi:hypothetical protein
MTADNVGDRLKKLSRREREVLRLRCQKLSYVDIGEVLSITEAAVKTYMAKVYVKFELDRLRPKLRWEALDSVYCPRLKELEGEPAPPDPPGEDRSIVPAGVLALVEEDERALVTTGGGNLPAPRSRPPDEVIVIPNRPAPRPGPGRGCLPGVLLGLLLGGLSAGGLLFAFRDAFRGAPQVTSVVMVTERPVTTTPSPAEPTATAALQEVVVTQLVEITREVEVTREVIVTATPPSASATPSLALPFEDNFDQGLRPEWRVLEGEPLITNGELQAAGQRLTLQMGDATLTDYTVRFDTVRACTTNNDEFVLTIAERVEFSMRGTHLVWRAFDGSNWQVLGDDFLSCPRNARVTVANGRYTVAISNAIAVEFQYGTAVSGPMTLTVKNELAIDNLTVTSP